MRAIRIAGKANQLRQNVRTPRLGMLQLFQHEGARPLPQHQPVAVGIKRSGGEIGGVIFQAGSKQRIEHRRLRGIQLFRTTGQHGQLLATLDGLKGVAQTLAA